MGSARLLPLDSGRIAATYSRGCWPESKVSQGQQGHAETYHSVNVKLRDYGSIQQEHSAVISLGTRAIERLGRRRLHQASGKSRFADCPAIEIGHFTLRDRLTRMT